MTGNIQEQKQKKEIKVFKEFMSVCPVQLKEETVKGMDPPHPDIKVQDGNKNIIYFEITKVVDEDLCKRIGMQETITCMLKSEYGHLESNIKKSFDDKYRNCLIHIWFYDHVDLPKRKKSVKNIIDFLLCDVDNFSSKKEVSNFNNGLKGIVQEIILTKGSFNGPNFQVNACGSINSNPIMKQYKKKIQKKYKNDYSIELLLYYDFQSEQCISDELDFAKNYFGEMSSSIFKRIWIYSLWNNKILYLKAFK